MTLLVTVTAPPCNSAISRTSASPSPVPGTSGVLHPRDAVELFENTRAGPARECRNPGRRPKWRCRPCSGSARMVTSVPAGLYLMAFETRFSTARPSRSASANSTGRPGESARVIRMPRCAATGSSSSTIRCSSGFDSHRSFAQGGGAGFQAGDVQVFGDHAGQALDLAVDGRADFLAARRVHFVVGQQFGHALDGRERRAHFVRDQGDHVVLGLLQFVLAGDVGKRGDDSGDESAAVFAACHGRHAQRYSAADAPRGFRFRAPRGRGPPPARRSRSRSVRARRWSRSWPARMRGGVPRISPGAAIGEGNGALRRSDNETVLHAAQRLVHKPGALHQAGIQMADFCAFHSSPRGSQAALRQLAAAGEGAGRIPLDCESCSMLSSRPRTGREASAKEDRECRPTASETRPGTRGGKTIRRANSRSAGEDHRRGQSERALPPGGASPACPAHVPGAKSVSAATRAAQRKAPASPVSE